MDYTLYLHACNHWRGNPFPPMARKTIYAKPGRFNVILDEELHEAAIERAKNQNIDGGFSGYVARLLVADMNKKRSVAHRFGRFLKKEKS